MNQRRASTNYRQTGATLAEFCLVAAAIFTPLLLLTGYMGKHIESKQHFEQALRYSAWERTVWFAGQPKHPPPNTLVPVKDDMSIAREIQARVLADRRGVIENVQRTRNPTETIDPILYLQDRPSSSYKPILKKENDQRDTLYVKNSQRNERIPGAAAQGVDTALNVIRGVTSFDVKTDGMYRAKVVMDLEDIGWLKEFKGSNDQALDLRADRSVQRGVSNTERQLMLLADGWNTGGRGSTTSQVKSLLLTEFLDNEAIHIAQDVVGFIPWASELASDSLKLGYVDPDQVPAHRLGRYPQ